MTIATLNRLQNSAYQAYVAGEEGKTTLSFQEWRSKQCSEIPQFKFWDTTLHFELAMLQLVRAFRSANFDLYVESLSRLIPWLFALDHVHYARWLSVHVQDRLSLDSTNPSLAEAFRAGMFVLNKTSRAFSSMALDHAHEQVNARLKGDGGKYRGLNSPTKFPATNNS